MAVIKEKEKLQTDELTAVDLISDPPVFNLNRAKEARSLVESTLPAGLSHYETLRLALALALYNTKSNINSRALAFVYHKYSKIIEGEILASDPNNLLPTIGFEVESPKKPFNVQRDTIQYRLFFDEIGMPRNKVNVGRMMAHFWEFSPAPSYSAAVQRSVLHELIEGRFIPSLRYSQKPADIQTYLDDKLVSLHLNLGIPNATGEKIKNLGIIKETSVFASMFAYAFTSSLRLRYRSQADFIRLKEAEQTVKGGGPNRRLELKSFEVATETTYRLMEEVQTVAAAMFADFGGYRSDLSSRWKKLHNQVETIYQEYEADPAFLSENKFKAAILASDAEFVRKLRRSITNCSLDIKHLLDLPLQKAP